MIVRILDVAGPVRIGWPLKANPPFLVNANAVLAGPIA
jgi:hypothetical protein